MWKGVILGALVTAVGASEVFVAVKDGKCEFQSSKSDKTVAMASWRDEVEKSGWAWLEVVTVNGKPTLDQALGAGCVQGKVSAQRAAQYWKNYAANTYPNATPSTELLNFMEKQREYARSVGEKGEGTFGVALKHVLMQFDGLVMGYKAAGYGDVLDETNAYLLESVGDLETINGLYKASLQANLPDSYRFSDCSGFVRLLGNGDVLVGHTTWRDYYAMLRMVGIWRLAYAPGGTMTASSSPGFTHSKDDFYVTGKGLIVFETTNSVFNETLLNNSVKTDTILTWQRAQIATLWSTSGEEWTGLFEQQSSSTYNNQWVVVDSKRVAPLREGAMWVLEQTAGLVESFDLSYHLSNTSYWPSYNIPYFANVFNVSGYPAMVQKYGDDYSYTRAPRARIFARNATTITSLDKLQQLMRYNHYQTDPLSKQDPVLGAIAARADLDSKPKAFGGVDSKITSTSTARQGSIQWKAISGPTRQGQTPFSFAKSPFEHIVRDGVPTDFEFDWVDVVSA